MWKGVIKVIAFMYSCDVRLRCRVHSSVLVMSEARPRLGQPWYWFCCSYTVLVLVLGLKIVKTSENIGKEIGFLVCHRDGRIKKLILGIFLKIFFNSKASFFVFLKSSKMPW